MNKLYKYYSSRLNLKEYLENPTIRISQIEHLNDPFEGFITGEVLSKLIEKVKPIVSPGDEMTTSSIRKSRRHIMRQIDSIGITSLSETSRNLLMWSHYASEHKGVCIGYKTPLINPHPNSKILSTKLKKVNYDSLLFDHDHINLLKNSGSIDDIFEELEERILTTKSEGWSYEKEYRYITPIEHCDIIRIYKTRSNLPIYIAKEIDIARENKSHEISESESHIDLISNRTTQQLVQALHSPNSLEMNIKKSKDVHFLKRIPKESIESIYFGSKTSMRDLEVAYDIFETDRSLHHINVYCYELSKERYEITPIPFKINSRRQLDL